MNRRPFKLITYDKKCQLEQKGTDKRFEKDETEKIILTGQSGGCMDKLSPPQNLSHWAVGINGAFIRTPPLIHIPMANRTGTMESYPVCIGVTHQKRSMAMKVSSKQGLLGLQSRGDMAKSRAFFASAML